MANDPNEVVVRFTDGSIADYSGLEALNTLAARYERFEKKVVVEQLVDSSSRRMLKKVHGGGIWGYTGVQGGIIGGGKGTEGTGDIIEKKYCIVPTLCTSTKASGIRTLSVLSTVSRHAARTPSHQP